MSNDELKYYLDTNAVRSLAPQLGKCKEVGAFISIWSVCEMLGHILKHPKEYGKIRRNFQSIRDSQIRCIVKMPPELHYGAFGLDLLVPMGDVAWRLTQMALLAMEAPTYGE